MGDLGGLWKAGRAAGKDQGDDVLCLHRLAGDRIGRAFLKGGLKVEAGFDARAFDVEVVAYCVLCVLCCCLELGDVIAKVIGVDEDDGGGPLHNVCQLLPVEPPVEGGVDGAQFGAGEEAIQVLHPVAGQDRHAVPFADAGHVPQPVGEPGGPLVHLPVGQPPFGGFPRVDDGEFFRAVDRPSSEVVANVHWNLLLRVACRV